MSQAEIGALRVVLGMDIAQFSEGAKKAGSELDKLTSKFGLTQKNLERAALAISAAFVAAAAGIALGIKSALDRADELSKLSQKIGIPIEQLSGLAYAADLAGVPLEGLANGIKKLSVNLEAAASGEVAPAASRALAALGISATDASGKLRPTNDVLLQLAEKFAGLKDGAGKTALAVAIFGKQGAELIPLLNQGASGLAEMTDRAQHMGLVLDAQTGKAAEEFNDRLTDISYATRGLFTQISAELLPVINDLTTAFADWVRGSGDAEPAAKAIAHAITEIYIAAIETFGAFEKLEVKLNSFWARFMAPFDSSVKDTIEKSDAAMKKIDQEIEERKKKIDELANNPAAAGPLNQPKGQKEPPIIANTQKATEAQRELNKQIQEGINLAKQARDPYQVMTDNIKALDAAMKAGKITAEQYGEAHKQAILIAVNAYAGAASDIAGSLSQVFSKSKGVAIAQAIINSFQAATNALAHAPWPLNYAAAAAALAAGFAQVANIKKTTEHSSGGGSSSVGASSAQVAPAAPQQSVSISLQGQSFGRDQVRGLIEQINGAISDGAVLRIV